MIAKRGFDVAVAAIGLVLASLPMLLAAVLTKATSRGPVFYRQTRVGLHGRPFTLYKFRSMAVRGGEGPSVTAEGDNRITPIGSVLRRWKIDELPQLWSVLIGDMSIIGPRPEVERFVRRYTPEQRRILDQRPGLASMAQLVYPHESELLRGLRDPELAYAAELLPRKIAVDLEYERRRTLFSDFVLLAEIGLMVLGRRSRADTSFRLDQPPAGHEKR